MLGRGKRHVRLEDIETDLGDSGWCPESPERGSEGARERGSESKDT